MKVDKKAGKHLHSPSSSSSLLIQTICWPYQLFCLFDKSRIHIICGLFPQVFLWNRKMRRKKKILQIMFACFTNWLQNSLHSWSDWTYINLIIFVQAGITINSHVLIQQKWPWCLAGAGVYFLSERCVEKSPKQLFTGIIEFNTEWLVGNVPVLSKGRRAVRCTFTRNPTYCITKCLLSVGLILPSNYTIKPIKSLYLTWGFACRSQHHLLVR